MSSSPPIALGAVTFQRLSQYIDGSSSTIGVILVHGQWHSNTSTTSLPTHQQLSYWTRLSLADIHASTSTFYATIAVDETNDDDLEFGLDHLGGAMPSQLPALVVVVKIAKQARHYYTHVRQVYPYQLLYPHQHRSNNTTNASFDRIVLRLLTDHVDTHVLDQHTELSVVPSTALRLWIAGDRSTVGKSSICLGLLMTLLSSHDITPEEVAYMKPATQSEASSLIGDYCDRQGIANRPIGPLVYYRGMTRAFLAGSTAATDALLQTCAAGVDRIARGKRLVLLDGVGFPAVGSICGTSNAAVAAACGAHGIVIVGGPGVGAAVDAYNLNATYFRYHAPQIPVLGAIFNKLPTAPESYYSLAACREQVTSYFQQYQPREQAFGFVPLWTAGLTLATMEAFAKSFTEHVDVAAILKALREGAVATSSDVDVEMEFADRSSMAAIPKRQKVSHVVRSRQEIEQAAISAGAAPSA